MCGLAEGIPALLAILFKTERIDDGFTPNKLSFWSFGFLAMYTQVARRADFPRYTALGVDFIDDPYGAMTISPVSRFMSLLFSLHSSPTLIPVSSNTRMIALSLKRVGLLVLKGLLFLHSNCFENSHASRSFCISFMDSVLMAGLTFGGLGISRDGLSIPSKLLAHLKRLRMAFQWLSMAAGDSGSVFPSGLFGTYSSARNCMNDRRSSGFTSSMFAFSK